MRLGIVIASRDLDLNTGLGTGVGAGIYSASSSRFPPPKLSHHQTFPPITFSIYQPLAIHQFIKWRNPSYHAFLFTLQPYSAARARSFALSVAPSAVDLGRPTVRTASSGKIPHSAALLLDITKRQYLRYALRADSSSGQATNRPSSQSLAVLSHRPSVYSSHCRPSKSLFSCGFPQCHGSPAHLALHRVSSEASPGEWARPEPHTLPKPTEHKPLLSFFPLYIKATSTFPLRTCGRCTSSPVFICPVINSSCQTPALEPTALFLLLCLLPPQFPNKPRPPSRARTSRFFNQTYTLIHATSTRLRDGAQKEQGPQGPEC